MAGGGSVSQPGCVYLNLSEVKLAAGGRPISPTLRGEAAIGGVWGGGALPRTQGAALIYYLVLLYIILRRIYALVSIINV